MTVFVVRASRPHVLILFYPTEAEFDIKYRRRLTRQLHQGRVPRIASRSRQLVRNAGYALSSSSAQRR